MIAFELLEGVMVSLVNGAMGFDKIAGYYNNTVARRGKQGTNITRILYFFVAGHKIILTNGFVKKTQKTPSMEISLAKKYREDFLSRKEHSS